MQPVTDQRSAAPSPHGVRTFDELVARLRLLRAWSGLGYHEVHRRIVALRQPRRVPERLVYNTVYRCFQPGRSRLDVELVVDIARVLLGDDNQAAQWRVAYQVIAGLATEAEIVTVSWALPDDLAEFTGRRAELDSALDVETGTPVVAINGMAGVGKTQLAIHAGRCLVRKGRFADLQVWVNLRGHDPDRPPADPSAVLGAFLRRLGVPGDQIYHLDLAGRTARYRELLDGRRALIVLDNAATEEQVRPLLPGGTTSLTLVTSRRALTGLRAARHLRLDVFTAREAMELLRRAAGAARIDADPDTAARIAHLVGHLPLALGLVAGRITHSPDWTLADHLSRLVERNGHRRLDDGVELALHTSYDALPTPVRRMFRLLALHPGGDLDAYAAAALTGSDLDDTRRRLDDLLAANLVQQKASGRYELHDIVRLYAAARAVDDEPDSARRDALTRLLDHYLHTAAAAAEALYPGGQRSRPAIPDPPSPVPPVAEEASALAWLDAERPNLLAAVEWAAAHGWPSHTHRMATVLGRHLDIGGRYGDALALHRHALEAARLAGDRAAEATALGNLGIVSWRVSRNDDAVEFNLRAIELFREAGDRTGEALALCNLGLVHERAGRYEEASGHYRRALTVFREVGHRPGEGATLNNLAVTYTQLGLYEEAFEFNLQALEIRRAQGDRAGEALALCNLGGVHTRLGRIAEATEHHRQALAISREIGFRNGEGYALTSIGAVHELAGRISDAVSHHEQALVIAAEIGDVDLEVEAHNNYGRTLLAGGRPADALRHHESALTVARDAGIRHEYARAHDGIAHTLHATGALDRARHHWQAALTVYLDLHAPEAAEIRSRLAGIDTTPTRATAPR